MFSIDLSTAPPPSVPTHATDLGRRLPHNASPFLMWHTYTGLVVSPLNRSMPLDVVVRDDSKRIEDYMKPRHLIDSQVYYAFYPRKPIHGSYLFSDLAITPQAIEDGIQVLGSGQGYVVNHDLQNRLSRLEDSLLSVAFTLLARLPVVERARLPDIAYSRWPMHHGYKKVHGTLDNAIRSCRFSMEAFTMLSAFVSFTLSLWLTDYEATCLDDAFEMLATRPVDPVPRVWLQYLKESIICDFSPGLRPGAFLDSYTTTWGFFDKNFTRACVPLWFVWGMDHQTKKPFDHEMYRLLPPDDLVERAKRKPLEYRRLILPSRESYVYGQFSSPRPAVPGKPCESYAPLPVGVVIETPEAVDPGKPVDPSTLLTSVDRRAVVEEHSRQRPYESWPEFAKRMGEALERRKAIESAKERQSRESLEEAASKKGYTKATSVFFLEAG